MTNLSCSWADTCLCLSPLLLSRKETRRYVLYYVAAQTLVFSPSYAGKWVLVLRWRSEGGLLLCTYRCVETSTVVLTPGHIYRHACRNSQHPPKLRPWGMYLRYWTEITRVRETSDRLIRHVKLIETHPPSISSTPLPIEIFNFSFSAKTYHGRHVTCAPRWLNQLVPRYYQELKEMGFGRALL